MMPFDRLNDLTPGVRRMGEQFNSRLGELYDMESIHTEREYENDLAQACDSYHTRHVINSRK